MLNLFSDAAWALEPPHPAPPQILILKRKSKKELVGHGIFFLGVIYLSPEFVTFLQQISVWFNEQRLIEISPMFLAIIFIFI